MRQQRRTHKSQKTAPEAALAGKPRRSPVMLSEPPPLAPAKAEPPSAPLTHLAVTFPDPMGDKIAAIAERREDRERRQKESAERKAAALEAPADTGIPEPDPTKQWWYRRPDSKARKQCEQIALMDASGVKDVDIAKRLNKGGHNYTPQYIANLRYIARKNGWWDSEDQPIDVEADLALEIDRKVVRNVSAALDGQMTNWQTHEMTIQAAKGRGLFKNHEIAKHEGAQTLGIIGVQIIMPPNSEEHEMLSPDECGGVPGFIEGEIEPAVSGLSGSPLT